MLGTAALAGERTWNVTDTGQPSLDAEFTVNEGTWMSVDVSPDGSTLAFDLLGDIYLLPATGGDARLVHGGPAMQIFPSFSADGSKLLYQSDESGFDNAWISNVDGSNARQVTHDAANMLGAPTWGPNDDSVAVVQAYSTFQLMKASEIRLFDLHGGERARCWWRCRRIAAMCRSRASHRTGKSVFYHSESSSRTSISTPVIRTTSSNGASWRRVRRKN